MENRVVKKYLLKEDLSSYDPYDIWKTNIGQSTKRLYYKNRYLGLTPAGLLTVFDMYINNRLKIGYKKQEYPITRAQASLALLNLYEENENTIYLKYAKKHIDWLLENSLEGYSGKCWGLNFDWVYSADETYDKNIPFSTHTPYPLEAMVKYYHITQDKSLIEPIKSILLFLENDIKIIAQTDNKLILSYGVKKDRIVTNSNSYLMYIYSLLIEFFPKKREYIENKIHRIYNFLCSVQRGDGSWLYSPYDDETFIDCFHSAFILKNIMKSNQIIKLNGANTVIERGYKYILENFIDDKKFLFKRFSKSNRLSLVKFDLYDNAEMLNLSILLKDTKTSERLEKSIRENFIKNGEIASIIDIFGILRNFNCFRWAVVPYIYALSNLKENNRCVD